MTRRLRGLALGGIVLLVLVGLLAALTGFAWREATGQGPAIKPVTLILARGSSLSVIASDLARAGAIRHAWVFEAAALARRQASELKAGEYRFPAHATILAILEQLREGRVVVHRLTIPEGTTIAEAMRLLQSAYGLSGPLPPTPPEGSILPETYDYTYGMSRSAMLARMERALKKLLAILWTGRQKGLPLASPEQAVILASIVEKETALAPERAHIAGVFYNRLARGMRLQSDPTVAYGLTLGRHPLGRLLTDADLKSDTPYNTYRIAGLPPGPIDDPGRASLEAVLNPLATPDLYFVANGTGGHAFATTLAAHERNVRAWRKIESESRAGSGKDDPARFDSGTKSK